MADFDSVVEKTLAHEGLYSFDPIDKGGETYKGVSRRAHPNWKGWKIIDSTRPEDLVTKIEMEVFIDRLKELDYLNRCVNELYKTRYWERIKGDDILNEKVAESIFDFAVNAGVVKASKMAQEAAIVKVVDGIIGPKSIRSINHIPVDCFLNDFAVLKTKFYINICKRNPKQKRFFYGWIIRAMSHTFEN